MRTKHYAPEVTLANVIEVLERDDKALESGDRARRTLLDAYRGALLDLLTHGPLACGEAVLREAGDDARLSLADSLLTRAKLLQLLRSAVRGSGIGVPSSGISLYQAHLPGSSRGGSGTDRVRW